MSMDAGGLAQMSYNNFPSIGVPTSGFGSRRKGANIERLSFEPHNVADPQNNGAPTPRTSRSHLLAGLRTAPKSATNSTFPPTAPPTFQSRNGLENSIHANNKENSRLTYGGPKTSIGSTFSTQSTGYNRQSQMYSLPEQILAPPAIHVDEPGSDQMDPNLYAQLVATNMYLAEQQQRLQQQLISVQAAAQQFQGLNLNHMGQHLQQQSFQTPPVTPNIGLYQQQVKHSMQPIVTPVLGAQPGVYSVYNPLTGQQSYFVDQNAQQVYVESQRVPDHNSPPQHPGTPRFQVSPPTNTTTVRSISPPKNGGSPPQDHSPLPPPSANAFRRGHKKASSLANIVNAINTTAAVEDGGPKTSVPKTAVFPSTPMTGTFGPGAARAGEHPIRQPRGPPSLDELRDKPTAKFEGSKNFAARQRRHAVSNLVRAGMERRRAPGSGSGSAGSITPISEHGEMSFSASSDNDSDSGCSGSGSLAGRPSLGSSRTSAHGAIGSNRPSSRQKERFEDQNATLPAIGDENGTLTGSFAAVFKNGGKKADVDTTPRKAPMLVLTSAEKRKGPVF